MRHLCPRNLEAHLGAALGPRRPAAAISSEKAIEASLARSFEPHIWISVFILAVGGIDIPRLG